MCGHLAAAQYGGALSQEANEERQAGDDLWVKCVWPLRGNVKEDAAGSQTGNTRLSLLSRKDGKEVVLPAFLLKFDVLFFLCFLFFFAYQSFPGIITIEKNSAVSVDLHCRRYFCESGWMQNVSVCKSYLLFLTLPTHLAALDSCLL